LQEAARHEQEECNATACELLAELLAIRLAACDAPAELAQELEVGVPASIRHEVSLIVPWSSSLERILDVVVARECEKCWKQVQESASRPKPAPKRRRGRGVPPDVVDHQRVIAACEKFGNAWHDHLAEICEQLERNVAEFPKSFKQNERLLTWQEVAEELRGQPNKSVERRLKTYLRYRLKRIQQIS
jgi:hypothetical protein